MMQLQHERDVFLAAVHAAPDDVTPRLVFADWLDERGEPDGELVRLLCEVQVSRYGGSPAWKRTERLTVDVDAEVGRLGERDRRLFACDCAERALLLFEKTRPNDERPRQAIRVGRRYAVGRATRHELDAAAEACGAMAWALLRSTVQWTGTPSRASLAALSAAWACDSCWAFGRTVGGVVGGRVAGRAASYAARAVGRRTERRWQLCRAVEYRLGFVPPPEFPREDRP